MSFFSGFFQDFLFPFVFLQFYSDVLSCVFIILILVDDCSTSWSCFLYFRIFGTFSVINYSNIFPVTFYHPLMGLSYRCVLTSNLPYFASAPFYIFISFAVYDSACMFYTYQSFSSSILCSFFFFCIQFTLSFNYYNFLVPKFLSDAFEKVYYSSLVKFSCCLIFYIYILNIVI